VSVFAFPERLTLGGRAFAMLFTYALAVSPDDQRRLTATL
jgi:hypothetical protein